MALYLKGRRVRADRLVFLVAVVCVIYFLYASGHEQSHVDVLLKQNDGLNDMLNKGPPNKLNKLNSIDELDDDFLQAMDQTVKKCPDYVSYSQIRHPPFSKGPYKFPYMRPAPKCRTFISDAVEFVIKDLKTKVKDVDLGRLIENCLPNTLDTTILWHVRGDTQQPKMQTGIVPQSFVVTGDIHAEWLRDSARQLSVYHSFVKYDPKLREMIKGAINTQILFILNSPYCNAFHPPPGSSVKKGSTAMDDVYPRPDWRQVFECKYELDSLASFLTLSNEYIVNSGGDTSIITDLWIQAYERILVLMRRESQPTFDEKTGQALNYFYAFKRDTNIGSETLPLAGVGNPVNFGTGLVRSAFRPSDDACVLQFFIPANMHMLTELKNTRANILTDSFDAEGYDRIDTLKLLTDQFIEQMTKGIEEYGIIDHPKFGRVYAYEVDGYGGSIFMDDANIPSLLSAPDMGFVDISDEVYQNTRKMILSKEGNPYFLQGKYFHGIGGPHIGIQNAWPMSLLMAIRTSDDDEEIMNNLKMVMENTAGLGLMHESIHVNSKYGRSFTRSWFAWCNSEFGKTILYLAKNKPHLIFKDEYAASYDIDKILSKFKP